MGAVDETEVVIMWQQMGCNDRGRAHVPFDGVQFHDEPVTAGVTYVYQVIATNEGGEAESNQFTFVAP